MGQLDYQVLLLLTMIIVQYKGLRVVLQENVKSTDTDRLNAQ